LFTSALFSSFLERESINSNEGSKLMLFAFFVQKDWDLRLACLLLYAFDVEDNFWQLYSDFLPSSDECTSLLLAPKVLKSKIMLLLCLPFQMGASYTWFCSLNEFTCLTC
jgi:hypothetical protein